jgi:hypothetical protein
LIFFRSKSSKHHFDRSLHGSQKEREKDKEDTYNYLEYQIKNLEENFDTEQQQIEIRKETIKKFIQQQLDELKKIYVKKILFKN